MTAARSGRFRSLRELCAGLTLVLAGVALLACQGLEGELGGSADGVPGVPGAGAPPDAPADVVGVTRTDPCSTEEQSFETEVYAPIFSRCIGCHNEFGLARQFKLELKLALPGEPQFAERNVETLKRYSGRVVPGPNGGELSLLWAKPTGSIAHIGGQVIEPDSNEARLLASFVNKLEQGSTCAQPKADQAEQLLAGLTLASPRETYARAKLALSGVVATPEELDAMPDTEADLNVKLDELLAGEAFVERAAEMFRDWLLTDAYGSLVNGNNLMQQLRDYEQRSYFEPLCTEDRDFRCCDPADGEACCANGPEGALDPAYCDEDVAIDSVAGEPVELVKHLVRNNLPLTDLVMADYTMINPYSAVVYGMPDAERSLLFDTDPSNDRTEYKPARVNASALNNLRGDVYPHSGILTMPVTLVRYPSSNSNQQRTRAARLVLQRFLAIPVMKLADFSTAKLPPDADLEEATQSHPACTACHAAIDPIAAHFRNFEREGRYRPGNDLPRAWRDREDYQGFLDVSPTEAEEDMDPLVWLAPHIANHDRYALGVLMPVFSDLIGAEILTPPTDSLGEDYAAKYLAFRIQQVELQRLRQLFGGPLALRLKPLVKAIIMGPFFRAKGAPPELDPIAQKGLTLAGVGPGTLLTPEQLARKIESVTGYTYRDDLREDGRDMFRSFRMYRLMFGGTDWDATPVRYRQPNAMAMRIAMRMANQMACQVVPAELAQPDVSLRRLLPNVTPDTTPQAGGDAIHAEIRRLHRFLLAEDLAPGDPELEATYNLWSEVRAVGLAEIEANSGRRSNSAEDLPSACQVDGVLEEDPKYTVRAWMAVVAYLMSDGRFIIQ